MIIFTKIGEFLLSAWLWNISFGAYHVPINFFFMFFLFKIFARIKLIPAVLLSFFANAVSFVLFSLVVVGLLVYAFGMTYMPAEPWSATPTVFLTASIKLALIYIVLESLFFYLVGKRYRAVPVHVVIAMTVVSNFLSAWLSYVLLPK